MSASLWLAIIAALLLCASAWLFLTALSRADSERIMERLIAGQVQPIVERPGWAYLDRAFLRAGLGHPTERFRLLLMTWAAMILIGYAMFGWFGAAIGLIGMPLMLRLFVSWRYHKRVRRMVEQLPQLLDHTVRSLKSGRTLDGEQSPSEGLAQGKMLWDQIRERGQKNYEMIEKEIRENGEKWLAEMAAEEEKARQEQMAMMKGSFTGMFGAGPKKE